MSQLIQSFEWGGEVGSTCDSVDDAVVMTIPLPLLIRPRVIPENWQVKWYRYSR